MCRGKNNDKNKMNLPLSSSTVSSIAEKLPSQLIRLWNFQTFSLFCEKLRVIGWMDYFILQISWSWVEEKIIL